MSVFTLAISCLTTSSLPWFMDLTFQVPVQYCSLQHQTLLLSPVTSRNECCFHFASISSFFLELFLHWSPVAHWALIDWWSSFFSILSFCLFIMFIGFSKQEYWSGLPFPSPVAFILLNGLVVFPMFFNLSLKFVIRSSWSEPLSTTGLVFVDYIEVLHLQLQRRLSVWFWCWPSDDVLCRVISCVVGRGCLLWSVLSLSKILLVFTLFHCVLLC